MNDSFLFMFFRRMRVPLVVLISAYAIATIGFTLMPGVDDEGNPWRMSVFEAFYVVSYTGTTIGFGEVPYDFSPAQRMWTMVSIYVTVIAWLFSIGSIISLLQDPAYARALRRSRLQRAVRGLNEPFYLVCGYGDTGRMLTRALASQRHPVVVVDRDFSKIDSLDVEDFGALVTAFSFDARKPDNLISAGLRSRWCLGVLAVTGDERTNLKIAISARLLNHKAVVHARADSRETAENMRSFDTEHVILPVAEYVRRMRLAMVKPDTFRLYHWLASGPWAQLAESRDPPRGRWILCGYGRPGRAIHAMLIELGNDVTVIEADPTIEGLPEGTIEATGTQADMLQAGGIESADGILAVTDDDVDNLSILITARSLNPDLFLGALENGLSTHELFKAAAPDFLGQPSSVVAGTILSRIRSSLMAPFFEHLLKRDNQLARDLLARLLTDTKGVPPEISSGRISSRRSPAVAHAIESGRTVPVGALLRDPARRSRRLPLTVLMIRREETDILFPDAELPLQSGDRVLLAGRPGTSRRVTSLLESDHALHYVLTGEEIQHGWIWRQFVKNGGRGNEAR